MDYFQKPIDLKLWLNVDIIQQQNLLKKQFAFVFEGLGNSFSVQEFQRISPKSRGFKISRGNDLLGFPYQVLDLVRDFDSENGINIRLLNWFGNGLFITILLGKNRRNPIQELINLGFYFGLSENKWDYQDLILNENSTQEKNEIIRSKLLFHHWIKEHKVASNPADLTEKLRLELKKIIGILEFSQEQSRN